MPTSIRCWCRTPTGSTVSPGTETKLKPACQRPVPATAKVGVTSSVACPTSWDISDHDSQECPTVALPPQCQKATPKIRVDSQERSSGRHSSLRRCYVWFLHQP